MNINDYFPLGIAQGKAFFNRDDERNILENNIKAGNDVFVISPRRYGKTSLILKVLNEIKVKYQEIDLYTSKDAIEIEQSIVKGVFELIKSITPKHEQIINFIKEYFGKLNLKTTFGTDGFNIEIDELSRTDAAVNIMEVLNGLDQVLIKKKISSVLFIDEFQQVGKLAESTSIEGVIRHIAQKSKNLIFIFSGSNRHILSNMIDDKSKPLYKLCNRLNIERISKEQNIKHLKQASAEIWTDPLDNDAIEAVISLTSLHPYYVNALCNNAFIKYSSKTPGRKEILKVWDEYAFQEKSNTAKELDNLNNSQYVILKYISAGNVKTLTGKESLTRLKLSVNAVTEGIKKLIEKDFIYLNDMGEYSVLDPLIKYSLEKFTHGNH